MVKHGIVANLTVADTDYLSLNPDFLAPHQLGALGQVA